MGVFLRTPLSDIKWLWPIVLQGSQQLVLTAVNHPHITKLRFYIFSLSEIWEQHSSDYLCLLAMSHFRILHLNNAL